MSVNTNASQLPGSLQIKWPSSVSTFDPPHDGINNAIVWAALMADLESFRCIRQKLPICLDSRAMYESILHYIKDNGRRSITFADDFLANGGHVFVDVPSMEGQTPLRYAICSQNLAMVKLLLVRGASLTTRHDNAPPIAVFKKRVFDASGFLQPLRQWLVKMKDRAGTSVLSGQTAMGLSLILDQVSHHTTMIILLLHYLGF